MVTGTGVREARKGATRSTILYAAGERAIDPLYHNGGRDFDRHKYRSGPKKSLHVPAGNYLRRILFLAGAQGSS